MFGSHKRISIFDSMVLMTPRACGRVFGARSGTRWAVPQCRRARSASALVSRHPRRAGWALRSSPAASSSLRADAVAPELAPYSGRRLLDAVRCPLAVLVGTTDGYGTFPSFPLCHGCISQEKVLLRDWNPYRAPIRRDASRGPPRRHRGRPRLARCGPIR